MSKRQQQVLPVWRFLLTLSVLAVLLLLLMWRVITLQILDTEYGHDFLQSQGDARSHRIETIPAYRGIISDRHGEPLAISTPVASLWIDPQQLSTDPQDWQLLAAALNMPLDVLQAKWQDYPARRFVYLRRHMPPTAAQQIIDLGIKGVYQQTEYRRYYPAGEVAAHVVGFTNIDDRGQEGIELAFDQWLQGTPGRKQVLKDLHGNVIREIAAGQPAQPGSDLVLSIDLRLQYLAYRELTTALQRSSAKAGSIIMLDSHTGEVLAMVNQPSFNPNNRHDLSSTSLRNRAVTDVFEPGSTMKPLTIAAALESGRYQPDSVLDTDPGFIRIGSKTLLDPVNYGQIDLTQVLVKSSQVGISQLALDLDEQSLWELFHRFGLGQSTHSDFPGESSGSLPYRSRWQPIERATLAFGYGLSVTPLQLAQTYAVFASGGQLRPTTLLRQAAPTAGEQIISKDIADQILAMLEAVTEPGGTATRAQLDAYSAAGKTGTAHKVGKYGYDDDRYVALFAGFAPANDPRVVTVVVIDEPSQGGYYGGEVAAPVFANVMTDALRMLNVAPDKLMAARAAYLSELAERLYAQR